MADPLTLQEIGKRLGLSRERVRQLEAQALVKMRKACAERGIDLGSVLERPAEDEVIVRFGSASKHRRHGE